MNRRSLAALAAAVVCGLGAMYGANRTAAGNNPGAVEMKEVLVAARDLRVEEILKPDCLATVKIPAALVQPGSFTDPAEVVNRWVQVVMLKDEPIVNRKLAPKGSPTGLVARIPAGMRAVAVEVTEQSSVSGFVQPQHYVDVVRVRDGDATSLTGDTVLEDVLVLACGQALTRGEDHTVAARTVTLALTPGQVDILTAARARGVLTLSLRGLDDHAKAVRPPKPVAPEPAAARRPSPLSPPSRCLSGGCTSTGGSAAGR